MESQGTEPLFFFNKTFKQTHKCPQNETFLCLHSCWCDFS